MSCMYISSNVHGTSRLGLLEILPGQLLLLYSHVKACHVLPNFGTGEIIYNTWIQFVETTCGTLDFKYTVG